MDIARDKPRHRASGKGGCVAGAGGGSIAAGASPLRGARIARSCVFTFCVRVSVSQLGGLIRLNPTATNPGAGKFLAPGGHSAIALRLVVVEEGRRGGVENLDSSCRVLSQPPPPLPLTPP
jgi:hypothetical protein